MKATMFCAMTVGKKESLQFFCKIIFNFSHTVIPYVSGEVNHCIFEIVSALKNGNLILKLIDLAKIMAVVCVLS